MHVERKVRDVVRTIHEHDTVRPRYSAPAFNIILPIEQTNFNLKKQTYSYLYVSNNGNLGLKYDFDQSLEMRYSGI